MATAVHANVMMGRHPMAAVPPHAHIFSLMLTKQLLPNHTTLCYSNHQWLVLS